MVCGQRSGVANRRRHPTLKPADRRWKHDVDGRPNHRGIITLGSTTLIPDPMQDYT